MRFDSIETLNIQEMSFDAERIRQVDAAVVRWILDMSGEKCSYVHVPVITVVNFAFYYSIRNTFPLLCFVLSVELRIGKKGNFVS